MNSYNILKVGLLGLFLLNPIAGTQMEKDYGEHFKKLSPEIREGVLSHASFSAWLALSQTCKAWHETINPFLSSPLHHIDFTRHFKGRTTFKFTYAKSSFWVLAREYKESDDSSLTVVKINTADLKETLIALNITLGWSGRGQFDTHYSSGSANPVCFSPCPHGGVFVYAPVDASHDILYVNDSGIINSQSVLQDYTNSDYIDMICGEKHLVLNSKYGTPFPILFIPYRISVDGTICYTSETGTSQWPRFEKIPARGHSVSLLEDKFLLEINNGFLDEYNDLPNIEKTFIINPEQNEGMVKEQERNNYNLSSAPHIKKIVEGTVFPKHYKLLHNYSYLRQNNLLFLLGRLERPGKSGDGIDEVNKLYQGIDYREEKQYPYGIILFKNLDNSEIRGRQFLFDNRQLVDIESETMKMTNSYLFITTYFRKRSTPKLTAVDIRNIKRLLASGQIDESLQSD